MRKWKLMVWIGDPEPADQDRVIKIIRKAAAVTRKMQGRLILAVLGLKEGFSPNQYSCAFPGLDKILLIDRPSSVPDYQVMDLHTLAGILSKLIESQKPDLLLLPSGRTEDDLAGMLSVLYRCGSLTGCVDFYADQGRKLVKAVCLDTEGERELTYGLQGAFSIVTLRDVKNDDEPDQDSACRIREQVDRESVKLSSSYGFREEIDRESVNLPPSYGFREEIDRENINLPSAYGIREQVGKESMDLPSEIVSAGMGEMTGDKLPPYTIPGRAISVRLSGSSGSLRPDHKSITESECIVAGGRGLGSPEKFRIIKEFAEYLHAEYATSRPNVDAGWIGQDYQVGLSGKTVSPRIYIACGISGAAHHTIGMSSSRWILAINIDRNEPIFDIADVGIIGDAQAILRRVMEKLREEEEALHKKSQDTNKGSWNHGNQNQGESGNL